MNAHQYLNDLHLQLIEGQVKTYSTQRDALDAAHQARLAEINALFGMVSDNTDPLSQPVDSQ